MDVDIIVKEFSYQALARPNHSVFNKYFYEQFKYADTFLYNPSLVGRQFDFGGKIYHGGDINYIGVGVYSAKYGIPSFINKTMATQWNLGQLIGGQGIHNWHQIGPAMTWSEYGRQNFNSSK